MRHISIVQMCLRGKEHLSIYQKIFYHLKLAFEMLSNHIANVLCFVYLAILYCILLSTM